MKKYRVLDKVKLVLERECLVKDSNEAYFHLKDRDFLPYLDEKDGKIRIILYLTRNLNGYLAILNVEKNIYEKRSNTQLHDYPKSMNFIPGQKELFCVSYGLDRVNDYGNFTIFSRKTLEKVKGFKISNNYIWRVFFVDKNTFFCVLWNTGEVILGENLLSKKNFSWKVICMRKVSMYALVQLKTNKNILLCGGNQGTIYRVNVLSKKVEEPFSNILRHGSGIKTIDSFICQITKLEKAASVSETGKFFVFDPVNGAIFRSMKLNFRGSLYSMVVLDDNHYIFGVSMGSVNLVSFKPKEDKPHEIINDESKLSSGWSLKIIATSSGLKLVTIDSRGCSIFGICGVVLEESLIDSDLSERIDYLLTIYEHEKLQVINFVGSRKLEIAKFFLYLQ